MGSRIRIDPGLLLVILLIGFAVAPLTYPGFFQAQSGFLPVFNVEHLADAPNWGRVADPIRGEGKLPYLLAWPAAAWLGSGVGAIRSGYAAAFVLGALGIYAWARHWLGRKGAVLAAVVYTYLPWHLSTVYVRGAYAEAWLWALWPFMLWSIDRWIQRRFFSAAVIGLLALVAAFMTQPGLMALSALVLVAYAVVVVQKPSATRRLVATLGLVLFLLWLAARFVPLGHKSFGAGTLYPYQLLSAAWGDGLSFQLGLAAVGLTIVAVALWIGGRDGSSIEAEKPSLERVVRLESRIVLGRAMAFWLAVLLVIVILLLSVSALFWRITGFGAYLTFPWQALALAGLPLSFLAGSVIRLDERLATLPSWAGLVALVVLASYPYLAPEFTEIDPGPEPVAMFQAAEAEEPQIVLLDHEVTPPTEITPTLTLTLTWQAVQPVEDDYTVFVHVLAQDDVKVAQRDSRPCNGDCATNTWQPGEIVLDRYRLDLPAGAVPGPYRLALGLYLLESGERAAVVARDDRTVFLDVP